MKPLRVVLAIVFGSFVLSRAVLAADIGREAFEREIFGITEISHFSLTPERLSPLSAEAKANIVAAKSVLVAMLKALQDQNGKPRQYFSAALKKKFPTDRAFAQSVLGEETLVLGLLIEDFTVSSDGAEIVFHLRAIVDSEGSIEVGDKSVATLLKEGANWKLLGFEWK